MPDLISPAGGDIGLQRRPDGTYASLVTSGAYRTTATITRPSNTTAYTAGDVVGDTGGSAIVSLTSAGPSGRLCDHPEHLAGVQRQRGA
jgi:hypothetical protein